MKSSPVPLTGPVTLRIAADALCGPTDYADDQIWELVAGGSPPALALTTSYGLRAAGLRIFPSFGMGGPVVSDPAAFARKTIYLVCVLTVRAPIREGRSMAEQGSVMGPVDYLIVRFPGNKFSGEIIPELAALVQNGIIRVIDLVFIMRDETGELAIVEAKDLQGEMGAAYRELARHTDEWFSEADIEVFAEGLAKNSSAALLLFENLWATRLKEALKNADAELIDMGRIPPETIEKAEKRMKTAGGA
jgi:hypothetical protein